MHSEKFEKVKFYYETGRWNEKKVHDAVIKGWITNEEYVEIVDHKPTPKPEPEPVELEENTEE